MVHTLFSNDAYLDKDTHQYFDKDGREYMRKGILLNVWGIDVFEGMELEGSC